MGPSGVPRAQYVDIDSGPPVPSQAVRAITEAIATRHAQIKTLQADIEALQRAASIIGGKAETTAKATPASHRPNLWMPMNTTSQLDHEAEFQRAWSDPSNTRCELLPVAAATSPDPRRASVLVPVRRSVKPKHR